MEKKKKKKEKSTAFKGHKPPVTRPPTPVIFSNLADPPALIFASLRSLRSRACSAARWAAASASLVVAVSAMFARTGELCGSFSQAVMSVKKKVGMAKKVASKGGQQMTAHTRPHVSTCMYAPDTCSRWTYGGARLWWTRNIGIVSAC